MRFEIKYSIERRVEVECSNFNEASDLAKQGREMAEVIVSVRSI